MENYNCNIQYYRDINSLQIYLWIECNSVQNPKGNFGDLKEKKI